MRNTTALAIKNGRFSVRRVVFADAAILCTRRDFSRVSQSQAAYARMQSAGVKVAGAVINGIPIRQYAYQYGNYAYLEDSSMSA